jgi:hypothetical protein
MNLQPLIVALFIGAVLVFSTAACQAQTVDERPVAVVAQQDPVPPAKRPAQQSPSDMPLPGVNGAEQEESASGKSCTQNCSPCRPLRRCCRSVLSIFRRCR